MGGGGGDEFDSVNELVISDTDDAMGTAVIGPAKIPASNIKHNLNSFNAKFIDQNTKNPFNNNTMKCSKYSA